MTDIAVLTPTYRWGVDVTHLSLRKQSVDNFVWILADDLYDERKDELAEKITDVELIHFKPRDKPEGYFSDLANIYNEMIEQALLTGAKLAVSLQDYFWVPEFGLESFWMIHEKEPNDLITGIAHLMNDPTPDKVVHPEGAYSVFEKPYGARPKEFFWEDVRVNNHGGDSSLVVETTPIEWELNWAAFPLSHCRKGIRFDEIYGKHIGHENQDYAIRCERKMGSKVWLDMKNKGYGLPHKQYWPEQEASGGPHSVINMEMHQERCSTGFYGNI